MLLAGWEVHIVKNFDLGLENSGLGLRPAASGNIFKPEVTVFHYTY